jgi:hypothetical protein
MCNEMRECSRLQSYWEQFHLEFRVPAKTLHILLKLRTVSFLGKPGALHVVFSRGQILKTVWCKRVKVWPYLSQILLTRYLFGS